MKQTITLKVEIEVGRPSDTRAFANAMSDAFSRPEARAAALQAIGAELPTSIDLRVVRVRFEVPNGL